MRIPLLAVAVLVLAGCGQDATTAASSPPSTFTSTLTPSATPKPTSNVPTEPELNKAELRYLTALAKAMGEKDVQSLTAYSYVDDGYVACGRGADADGPPTVDAIVEHLEEDRDLYGAALTHLCPKYLPLWRKARDGFTDGEYTVGEDIRAGTYRTTPGRLTKCYWERSTGAGRIIDNQWVTNAPKGATVTVRRGEGFTSDGCGNWVRA